MARRKTTTRKPKPRVDAARDLAALAWTRFAIAAVPALVEKVTLADLLVPESSREIAAAAFNVADACVAEAAVRFRTGADDAPRV